MSDRKVKVAFSKDGGFNDQNWKERPLAELGQYQDHAQPTFRRCGTARQFQATIEVSSPIKATLLAAYGDIEELAS